MLMDRNNIFLLDIKERLLDLSVIPKKHEVKESEDVKMDKFEEGFKTDTTHVIIATEYLDVLVKILKKNKLDKVILDVKNDYPIRARFGDDQTNVMIIAPRVE